MLTLVQEIKIVLPFPLPTWNRILSMTLRERMKLKKWIKSAVYICIQKGSGWPTRTVSVEKLQLMGLSMEDYYTMIRPSTSARSLTAKKRQQ